MATAKPIKPNPVPQVYTPVPQRSDRVNFAERGDKMMTSLPPMVDGVNENILFANAATEFIDAAATSVEQLWSLVEQGVIDTQAALAALASAGAVLTVNGRGGVVTGLVETASPMRGPSALMSDAPLGQPTLYESTTGAGVDWPTTYPVAAWDVQTTGIVSRKHQVATQIFAGPQQGWRFERWLHDAAWSRWKRVLLDDSIIESDAGGSISTAAFTLDPGQGTVHHKGLQANTTISIAPARGAGDQVTLYLYQQGSYSFSFAPNVTLPEGVTIEPLPAGFMLPLYFFPKYAGSNIWYVAPGVRYPG